MDNNVNYTMVGAFVIFLTTAIVFAIIWLSSGLTLIQYSDYLMNSEESVSGLNVDASVEYNGVNVGSVKSITLDTTNPHIVKVLLSINNATPITRGTIATLTTRGVTGVAFVALKDLGDDLRPLTAEPNQEYPVIPTAPSIFMRLEVTLSRLTDNFQTITDSFSRLLDKKNLQSIQNSLEHIDKLTGSLAKDSDKFNQLITNTAQASAEFVPMLKQSTSALKVLDSQTLPSTYRLLSNMNDVMRNLNDVSTQLKQNPSILLRGAAPLPLGPGEKR